MQNSVVQVYAEQKNKEVTSQEFLDYINQLKEQNPNFKFNQGETKVFDSEAQALANLAEQKQAINTAISNYKQAVEERNTRYEQEKRDIAERNELIKQENLQKEQEYQAKLSAYNAKKAEVEQWKQANPIITQLDNGIKLRGNYDESKKNSINYFDNIAIDASKEVLETGGYETTSKSIKMSPNSTVEVINASSTLIDNTNGYIGGMTLDNYPIKTIKSWRIKAGTPAGELLNMNLRNIGETDSGKVISAHVKFVLDYATSDTRWVDISGKELKTTVTDTTTKPAGDIEHYSFVESRTDDDGNVTHVFRQYTTKWVDESGTELKDMVTDKDTKEHGEIKSYTFVRTEIKDNGDIVHIYKKLEQKKDNIPTGVHTNGLISMFMVLISSIGLALTNIAKKRED